MTDGEPERPDEFKDADELLDEGFDIDVSDYPLMEAYRERQIEGRFRRERLSLKEVSMRRRVLREIREFLELDEEEAKEYGIEQPSADDLREITGEEIHNLIVYLMQNGKAESTANTRHLSKIKSIRRTGELKGYEIEGEPVEVARDVHSYESEQEADYPNILLDEVKKRLRTIQRPDTRAIWVLGLKLGGRVSEFHNLDLQDIHIDYEPLNQCDDHKDITPRPEIRNRPDTIYIPSHDEIDDTTVYRGERRRHGNKRKNATIIPIDGELKHALVRWLAARPPTNHTPADPLIASSWQDNYRMSIQTISGKHVRDRANEWGWNDHENKDTIAHKWFRHYFTTHHRSPEDGWGVLYNAYFRGDNEPEGLESLSQSPYTDVSWLNTTEVYLKNIYKFDLPTLPTAHPY